MLARMTNALHQRLEHHAADLGDQPTTLGALAQAHGPALPGSLLVLVSAPCALPIPGVGNVLGVTMMVMALAYARSLRLHLALQSVRRRRNLQQPHRRRIA
jgi:hypothetical protein